MSSIYGKGTKGKATKLHAELVRARGYCQAAGLDGRPCNGRLECAHIVTRDRNATRTDEHNALCLCNSHHFFYTHNPFAWVRFVDGFIGAEAHDEINFRSKAGVKANEAFWQAEVDRLSRLLEGAA